MNIVVSDAYSIAVRCLRKNYSGLGILAGSNQFHDLWTRDACFACLGALELKDFAMVKRTLTTVISHQRKDGLLPFRVGDYNIMLKLFGIHIKKKVKARYVDDKRFNIVKDSNSLVVIVANEYVKKSGDLLFAKQFYPKLKRAIEYYGKNLISELPYGNWADSVPKSGKVLFTNVLFWKSLISLEELSKKVGSSEGFNLIADSVKEKINRVFWNGMYFNDTDSSSTFSSDGNVLAIIFGLASKAQKKSIMNCFDKFSLEDNFTVKISYPEFKSFSFIDWMGGMRDYHNLRWLWIGCLYSLIKKDMLDSIAKKICENEMVFEVYEKNGKPVRRWFYKSEINFAWSSGLFIYAARNSR